MRFQRLAALAAVSTLAASPAFAHSPQVFVSGKGADSAGCGTTAAPCRTFQYAHDSAVTPGGMIAVMDSGDYGPVRITKSVSIVNNGAGVAAIGPNAQLSSIEVAAGADGKVVLRGLTVDGGKTGFLGLRIVSARALDVSKCGFRNFLGSGMAYEGGSDMSFRIADSEFSDNVNSGIQFASMNEPNIDGVIRNSRFNRNGAGFLGAVFYSPFGSNRTFRVVVKDVEVNGGRAGFELTNPSPNTSLTLTGATIGGASRAALMASFSAPQIRLSRSVLINNLNPWEGGEGVTSSGDNQVMLSATTLPAPIIPMK
ncbi:hypothetical protein [Methylocystis sp. ATCC 49242]|uniref:hypothetical protein n=1 Tax=Methylocystis sp. ATCC 49242 TaxID=622637 RepID=UPI0001F8802D|nr:hypothetical protein [Methylocystis sp. ATCC 49242]